MIIKFFASQDKCYSWTKFSNKNIIFVQAEVGPVLPDNQEPQEHQVG